MADEQSQPLTTSNVEQSHPVTTSNVARAMPSNPGIKLDRKKLLVGLAGVVVLIAAFAIPYISRSSAGDPDVITPEAVQAVLGKAFPNTNIHLPEKVVTALTGKTLVSKTQFEQELLTAANTDFGIKIPCGESCAWVDFCFTSIVGCSCENKVCYKNTASPASLEKDVITDEAVQKVMQKTNPESSYVKLQKETVDGLTGKTLVSKTQFEEALISDANFNYGVSIPCGESCAWFDFCFTAPLGCTCQNKVCSINFGGVEKDMITDGAVQLVLQKADPDYSEEVKLPSKGTITALTGKTLVSQTQFEEALLRDANVHLGTKVPCGESCAWVNFCFTSVVGCSCQDKVCYMNIGSSEKDMIASEAVEAVLQKANHGNSAVKVPSKETITALTGKTVVSRAHFEEALLRGANFGIDIPCLESCVYLPCIFTGPTLGCSCKNSVCYRSLL